ncbi:MAG: hypothetical protein PW845_29970 [Pseudomonas sp.]|uniref:hypothetical protein n=1 Tax=Pseudomonas abieticivorans TaxID=2931382 RepID=UPI0020BFB2F4|nr:hypothetical protein [Pseudomonas sp. PIA16]MDE1169494.1 hypothetical protein [Pseudomonas sp.]
MKRALAFAIALSALTTSAAFATPQMATPNVVNSVAAHFTTDLKSLRIAENGSEKTLQRQHQDAPRAVYVAENRAEFGSQYQRY